MFRTEYLISVQLKQENKKLTVEIFAYEGKSWFPAFPAKISNLKTQHDQIKSRLHVLRCYIFETTIFFVYSRKTICYSFEAARLVLGQIFATWATFFKTLGVFSQKTKPKTVISAVLSKLGQFLWKASGNTEQSTRFNASNLKRRFEDRAPKKRNFVETRKRSRTGNKFSENKERFVELCPLISYYLKTLSPVTPVLDLSTCSSMFD